MDRILQLRQSLHQNHMDKGNSEKLKDIVFLDLALESTTRKISEGIMHIDIGFDSYIRELGIILSNLCLSFTWAELGFLKDDFEMIVKVMSRNLTEDNARKVKGVIDRIKQGLGEVNDKLNEML